MCFSIILTSQKSNFYSEFQNILMKFYWKYFFSNKKVAITI